MAKIGIPSFLLDCHTNDNISEIEAEYGVKGFAIVVRLWQKIYSEKGYYCEWIERSPLLFLSNWFGGNSGVTVSLITDIVNRCLKNGIFDAGMYEDYSILTSERVQAQYFDVVKRRENIPVKKEYLLVSVGKIKGIVYENSDSVCRNRKNVCRNDTSKGKGSKGNGTERRARETQVESQTVTPDRAEGACGQGAVEVRRFGEFLTAYPKGCNQYLTGMAYMGLVLDGLETEDNLVACAANYAEACKLQGTQERYIKNAENFLKEFVFEKYLPDNYQRPAQKTPKNRFTDFPQRQYGDGQLAIMERRILGK